jgi:hypothetical protein
MRKASAQYGLNFKWKNFFHLKFILEMDVIFLNLLVSLHRRTLWHRIIMYYVHLRQAKSEIFHFSREKDFQNWFNRHLSLGLAFKFFSILWKKEAKVSKEFFMQGDLSDKCDHKEFGDFSHLNALLFNEWIFIPKRIHNLYA